MKKIILSIFYLSIISIFLFLTYFSIFGFETNKFNDQIEKKVKASNDKLNIELNKIKLILDPFKFQIKVKTLGPKLIHNNKKLSFEVIQTKISIRSILKDEFSLNNLKASTNSIEIKNLISFIRSLNRSTELFILEKFIKRGYLIADIELNFDEKGNLKDNFEINGFIKDTGINFLNNYKLDHLNFIFNLDKKKLQLEDVELEINNLKFFSNNLNAVQIKNKFEISGEIENKNLILKQDNIDLLIKPFLKIIDIKNIEFNSNNVFSFIVDKKFKIENLKIKSKINFKEILINNKFQLKDIFPKINDDLKFENQMMEIDYKKNNLKIKGSGEVFIQENKDKINYSINKKNTKIDFESLLEINKNVLNINILDFEKDKNKNATIKIKGSKEFRNNTKLDLISLEENSNKILIKNLLLDKNFKIIDLAQLDVDVLDKKNNINQLSIVKKNKDYFLIGKSFNADNLLENILEDKDTKKILNKNFNVFIQVDELILDKNFKLKNFKGDLFVKNQEIFNGNLEGLFSKQKKLKFTIKSKDKKKITTLFLDEAKAIVGRYKFIKGFEGGKLDFSSSKQNGISVSKLKIYDFNLRQLPILTKILTLASLKGIADLVSGDGIRFNEFEMSFKNNKELMTINEIYAIGPAISILMDGYVEKNKLISLRGTLVPATTINKAIGSIPILGQILVGSKTGEGVFGVSFKIKGTPKNLETTVNPIKTLTPRFITRTLEKIKKAN